MKKIVSLLMVFGVSFLGFSQEVNTGEIHGDFDLNLQSYQEDELIEAEAADELILNNAYLNLNYIKGNFATGLRYESYLNALADYDPEFKGNGIPYRYATYSIDGLEVTAGNYYEQLGSGLIFRSYEEKGLGIDNAMDGVRLKYSPAQGTYLKTFIGKSRTHFAYSDGIFRGADGEININELLSSENKIKTILGGSFISRYQERSNLIFKIPQNVSAYAGRLNLMYGGWNYYGEYAYKINDPANVLSASKMNYASGNAFTQNITFSKRGFGVSAEIHRTDNMTFKSDRDKDGKAYLINYIPTLSKPHAYSLLALYPCATQADGEFGMQFDVFYKMKKGTLLGGKYGTKLAFNYSRINGLNGGNSFLNDNTEHSPMLISIKNEELYFQDINLEINKKINKKVNANFVIANQTYNRDLLVRMIEMNIRMVDYEVLKDLEGSRLLGFGRYAGIIGAYNAFLTYGLKSGNYILKAAHQCWDRLEMENELGNVLLSNERIVVINEYPAPKPSPIAIAKNKYTNSSGSSIIIVSVIVQLFESITVMI